MDHGRVISIIGKDAYEELLSNDFCVIPYDPPEELFSLSGAFIVSTLSDKSLTDQDKVRKLYSLIMAVSFIKNDPDAILLDRDSPIDVLDRIRTLMSDSSDKAKKQSEASELYSYKYRMLQGS